METRIQIFLRRIRHSTLIIGVLSLFWFLYRTGTKPSRVVYPCQRAAASNCYAFLLYPAFAFIAHFIKTEVPRAYNKVSHSRKTHFFILAIMLSLTIISSGLAIYNNILFDPLSVVETQTEPGQKVSGVSVVQVENNDLERSLQEALDYIGGISSIIPEGAKVLIKPNIVRYQAPPDTTDPAIVKALINLIKQRNPSVIWVAEGSGEGNTIENFMALGYAEIADISGVELVDLNYGDLVEVPIPGGGYVFDSFMFNKKVMEADVFISLACMKTHSMAVVTLGMKNLVGISAGSVYGVAGSANHWRLHEVAAEKGDTYLGGVITDLNSARRIDLTIIDGRVAMEGQGPHDGEPVNLGLIIVGKDPVATDTVASTIMGFDAEKIPTLSLAAQKGLGTNNLNEIDVKGKTIKEVFHPFAPAQGHSSFLLISNVQLLMYRWRGLLFLPTIAFGSLTVLIFFLSRRSQNHTVQASKTNTVSRQIIAVESKPISAKEEKKVVLFSEISLKQLEEEIKDKTSKFQQHVKQIEEASIRLDEASKLLDSGEISKNIYDVLMADLAKQLTSSVETLIAMRENLELIRSRAMIERSKNVGAEDKTIAIQKQPPKQEVEDLRFVRGYKDVVESQLWTGAGQTVYSPTLEKWDTLISEIDSALSSLPIDKELKIIEKRAVTL
ncbi:DUF362 domain-containing protein, partial [Candidatus Bathyarchaeota archaeon]|nr:DUF362 domain-containing protein [Candidatus Bathyarchaeota archaeon]